MTEEWRDIPTSTGYQVSNLGRVKSFKRNKEGIIMKQSTNPWWGYLQVKIPFEGKPARIVGVHRLVAVAFIGERPEGYHTHHIDHDKTNNRPENLAYVTPHENALAYAVVRVNKKRQEKASTKERQIRLQAAMQTGVIPFDLMVEWLRLHFLQRYNVSSAVPHPVETNSVVLTFYYPLPKPQTEGLQYYGIYVEQDKQNPNQYVFRWRP